MECFKAYSLSGELFNRFLIILISSSVIDSIELRIAPAQRSSKVKLAGLLGTIVRHTFLRMLLAYRGFVAPKLSCNSRYALVAHNETVNLFLSNRLKNL